MKTQGTRDAHQSDIASPVDVLPEQKANILLVGQSASLLTLQAILDNLGQNLVTARSGEEALKRLLEVDFAVILLDLPLDSLGALETARLIHSRRRSRQTPIIFLSASDSEDLPMNEMLSLGAVDCLMKPFVPEILIAKVHVFLELHQKTQLLAHQAEALRAAQEQSRRQTDQVVAAIRDKEQFLSLLAHALRNPLVPLRNGLEIMRSPAADASMIEQARQLMERQVKQMTQTIEDMLDVSRITQGKIVLLKERLDLVRLVRDVLVDQQLALEQAGLTIELGVPELPVWLRGDSLRLTRVLGNLLQNALKFTDRDGKIMIRISVDAYRGQAIFSIQDTGTGIEVERLPYLFQPFAQPQRGASRTRGGLGLGLALVSGFVQLHNGQVQAFSAGPGKGAEFVIRLPLDTELNQLA